MPGNSRRATFVNTNSMAMLPGYVRISAMGLSKTQIEKFHKDRPVIQVFLVDGTPTHP